MEQKNTIHILKLLMWPYQKEQKNVELLFLKQYFMWIAGDCWRAKNDYVKYFIKIF